MGGSLDSWDMVLPALAAALLPSIYFRVDFAGSYRD
jgi:hypothetical protein